MPHLRIPERGWRSVRKTDNAAAFMRGDPTISGWPIL